MCSSDLNDDTTPWVQLVKDAYYFNSVPHAIITSGSFWCRAMFSLSDAYRAITKCVLGNGVSILFWSDNWLQSKMEDRFPRLFSYAIDKLQSVAEFMGGDNALQWFHLPLSVEAHEEYAQMQILLQDVSLDANTKDNWVCTLGNGVFKPSKVYRLNFQHISTDVASCWIWKSKCQSKHKFFAWLILHDRINTQDMLIRRHWAVSNCSDCVLCVDKHLEDWRHLFFNCLFSTRVWNYLGIVWSPGTTPSQVISAAKRSFSGPCFVEVVILACWAIWKQRNGWIFNNVKPTFRGWKSCFVHEITMLTFRAKSVDIPVLSSWIDNLH